MYNVYGLGKRIAYYRKLLDMTQEELAAKLNVTAQAVSKWENEQSYPEITLLPELAKVLNTTMDKLFGNEEDALKNASWEEEYRPKFPPVKPPGLKLVHVVGGVGCYSDKEVAVTNGDTVAFKDGSTANLKQLKVVNKGAGDIIFEFMDIPPVPRNIDFDKTEIHEAFDKVDSVEVSTIAASIRIIPSEDDKTHVDAYGSPFFLAKLKISHREGLLSVKCDQPQGNWGGNAGGDNRVIIALACEKPRTLNASVNGHGNIDIEVPFQKGFLSINGSGDIHGSDFEVFTGSMNGSGDIDCNKVGHLTVNINGSGDFTAREIYGAFKASINGSGDIELKSGQVDTFETVIRGAGDIHAEGITANTANISVDGAGSITVGRVINESVEKHSRGSSIRILKRG